MEPRWDYARLSAELIRSLRGKRSQTALSRRLGYKTNVVYLWEASKAAPTAAGFFGLTRQVGLDPEQALIDFYRRRPQWLDCYSPDSVDGAAALLEDLKGKRTLVDMARHMTSSRYALARWLSGEAEPRLPDFLEAIEISSLRLLDFLAAFCDPAELPTVAAAWSRLSEARRVAYEMPWSHAILRGLELESYRLLPTHVDGWLAARLGISAELEHKALELLESTGQIRFDGQRWQIIESQTVDTRHDREAAKRLKAWWFNVGRERFSGDAPGVFSYNLFGVSHKDMARLEELQRAHFREIRNIVAQSGPVETVAVVNLQLFSLLTSCSPDGGE